MNQLYKKIVNSVNLIGRTLVSNGLDFSGFRNFKYLPRYFRELRHFKEQNVGNIKLYPILSDYGEPAGAARGHYFHQDLLVASFVYDNNPRRHVDVGSRIDGFVAHVASFRKIEVIDVRDLPPTGHPNIEFRRADLIGFDTHSVGSYDSVSCLHAIEHFGLGRYGDVIDGAGHIKGFNNLLLNLSDGGVMYISFPISSEPSVYFNAHRVFHPREIMQWPIESCTVVIERFDYVDDNGVLHCDEDIVKFSKIIKYGCGIYTVRKKMISQSVKQ